MHRVSKPPAVRRKELLDAAVELFLQKGYEATSVRDILGRVGGQPGMFYYYFASKAELFRAATDAYTAAYVEQVTAILEDGSRTVPDRFRAALVLAAESLARFNVALDQGAAVERTGVFSQTCLDFLEGLVPPAAALLREADPSRTEAEVGTEVRFFLYGMYGLMHDPALNGGEADLLRTAGAAVPLAARLLGLPLEALEGEVRHG